MPKPPLKNQTQNRSIITSSRERRRGNPYGDGKLEEMEIMSIRFGYSSQMKRRRTKGPRCSHQQVGRAGCCFLDIRGCCSTSQLFSQTVMRGGVKCAPAVILSGFVLR